MWAVGETSYWVAKASFGSLWDIAVVVATATMGRFVLAVSDSVWGGIEWVFKDSKYIIVP